LFHAANVGQIQPVSQALIYIFAMIVEGQKASGALTLQIIWFLYTLSAQIYEFSISRSSHSQSCRVAGLADVSQRRACAGRRA
jgi:hypothetical protein